MTLPSQATLDLLTRYAEESKYKEPGSPALWREMYELVFDDNKKLAAEVKALRQRLSDFEDQSRLERLRYMHNQFPMKGRRSK